jgi:hypothetical protein
MHVSFPAYYPTSCPAALLVPDIFPGEVFSDAPKDVTFLECKISFSASQTAAKLLF